jgi:MFS family permease
VIADKVYHVHPSVLALISAAPMFGNLSSYFWARVAHGRPKVPLIVAIQAGVVLLVASIAGLPSGPSAPWVLVGAMVTARVLMGGMITVRSLVWTLNYPREARGRITMRLTVLATLTMALTPLLGGLVLDANPSSFRLVYAVGAALATLGVLSFSRVRVTGERRQLVIERRAADRRSDGTGGSLTMWGVLRRDRNYAHYQASMFMLGFSNMMVEATLVYLVSRELGASYAVTVALALTIPLALAIVAIPVWAAYLDRVHVSEFRSRHSVLFVLGHLLMWIGALYASLWAIALARVVFGVARGGGSLAWQIGHNDFASPENVGIYMGLHASLTGLRGLIAPFTGMLLYVGWSAHAVPGTGLALPAFEGIGPGVMLASVTLSILATLSFARLHRRMSRARSG